MKQNRKNLKKKREIFILASIVAGIVACATTFSWAALTYVSTLNPETKLAAEVTQTGTAELPRQKSRAPEPSTLALFGSGLMGMLISFVRKTYHAAKRVIDILISILAIIVLSPLFLLMAILIKITSSGPVIFTQMRVGRNGRLFKIFKFRTMHSNAEDKTGPVWAAENDSRLIPCGRFLRKTHIDEIPQFFNVLRGEMSVIGPRPERPEFVSQFKQEICDYEKRLAVKPGITGMAQVWHKYDETIRDVRKKIKYDLLYIKKYCLWTDILILLRTFRVVVTGEGSR